MCLVQAALKDSARLHLWLAQDQQVSGWSSLNPRNHRVSQGPCLPSWLNLMFCQGRLFSLLPFQRYSPLCRTTAHIAMKGQGCRPQPPSSHETGCVSEPQAFTASHEVGLVHPSPGGPSGQQMQGLHLPRSNWSDITPK